MELTVAEVFTSWVWLRSEDGVVDHAAGRQRRPVAENGGRELGIVVIGPRFRRSSLYLENARLDVQVEQQEPTCSTPPAPASLDMATGAGGTSGASASQ